MKITKHFIDRVAERFGVFLSWQEINEISKKVKKLHLGIDFVDGELIDIFLHHHNLRFTAIVGNGKLVTAHAGKKMGRKRYLKCLNLGTIKKT